MSVVSVAPVAQKEEEDYQRLRETMKAVAIDEPPELLGEDEASYMWEGLELDGWVTSHSAMLRCLSARTLPPTYTPHTQL